MNASTPYTENGFLCSLFGWRVDKTLPTFCCRCLSIKCQRCRPNPLCNFFSCLWNVINRRRLVHFWQYIATSVCIKIAEYKNYIRQDFLLSPALFSYLDHLLQFKPETGFCAWHFLVYIKVQANNNSRVWKLTIFDNLEFTSKYVCLQY